MLGLDVSMFLCQHLKWPPDGHHCTSADILGGRWRVKSIQLDQYVAEVTVGVTPATLE